MNSRLLGGSSIVLAVLAVSVGMFIYNSAFSTITDSTTSISTLELEAFNEQFVKYEGVQNGENIEDLIFDMTSNAITYSEEIGKVPGLVIEELTEDGMLKQEIINYVDQDEPTDYINALNKIKDNINLENEYYVELTFQSNGLVDYIHISYDQENPITELYYRE